MFISFKKYLLTEDIAERGAISGMGEITFPTSDAPGSGDNFNIIGINNIIDNILKLTNIYTRKELLLKNIKELNVILNKIK